MADHVRVRQSDLGAFCAHCGAELVLRLPVNVSDYTAAVKAFERNHRDCPPPPPSEKETSDVA